ncbi:hypothetical protein [Tritonibacter mobilis]|uniref:hypothetical protein n=1 Tax=Tritonibacter mobilis TaxID=379347 RepID=UPI0014457FE7|nr:hypothetical protein [Rhodobacteraceae bacterium R_SAG5]
MTEISERRAGGRCGLANCLMVGALAIMALAGPAQARLPDDAEQAMHHSLGAQDELGDRRAVNAPEVQMSPLDWRCQSVCDESGHMRQSCLMLSDPRLSGLGQRLDHLSKSKPSLKSLGDLGLTDLSQAPGC